MATISIDEKAVLLKMGDEYLNLYEPDTEGRIWMTLHPGGMKREGREPSGGYIYKTRNGWSWCKMVEGKWKTAQYQTVSGLILPPDLLKAIEQLKLVTRDSKGITRKPRKVVVMKVPEEIEVAMATTSEVPSAKDEEVKVPVEKTVAPVQPKHHIKKPDLAFVESDNEIKMMIYAITTGKNVLLEGPTGCGKSFLIEELARVYGKKLYTVNCDIELDKSEVIGKYEIQDGKTIWIPGILPRAMEEGAWIVYDEINMGKPEVFSSSHSAFDHRRSLTIKEHQNEVIKAHPEFRAFATMNPEYAGTMELNFAFRRRFQLIIKMGYLAEDEEMELIMKMTGIIREHADKLVKIGADTRKMHSEGKLTHPVSTAHLLEFAKMLSYNGFKPVECAMVTLNTCDESGEQEDVLNVVKNYF